MLRAGIGRGIITPPLGMTMAGYAGREGVAKDIDEDLTATALLLDDGSQRAAIVSLDLAFTPGSLTADIRGALGSVWRIPPSHILLNCSHTHSGPTFDAFQYDDDPQQDQMRSNYARQLVEKMAGLGTEVELALKPARVGTATGEARIGIHRREVDGTGDVILGENPSGPVDHEVRVIRIDDLSGRPMGVVFSHGCHTVTMGPKSLCWSPDYVGPARRVLESNLRCLSMFLQANAGDINPITGIGAAEDNTNEKNRLGWMLGGEALKVHSTIYTESIRGPRTFFGTLAKASIYPRLPLPEEPDSSLVVKEIPCKLQLQALPSLEVARQLDTQCRADVAALRKEGASEARLNVARRYVHWSTALLDAATQQREPFLDSTIQVLRIGDLVLAAFPGETFSTLGMEVKRGSPFKNTLFMGYSNGCVCYIPTRDAFPSEGWSVLKRYHVPDMLFPAYKVPTSLHPGTGEMIVDKTVELLKEIYEQRGAGSWQSRLKSAS
ncbi:MAG: hypothetical protein HY236_16715 [Acidobacteria bacterium]|nr:hypothetical protein [Acidobacteriota bacterium]